MAEGIGVLYVSYDGMTDNLGQSQVIPYLQGLSLKGFVIHILSCEKPIHFEKRKKYISNLLEKSKIVWHPIEYTAKPAVISTIYDLHKLQKTATEIILNKANNIQILHCRSYISAHVGTYCKKHFNIPWIFDMRGFWADERVEGGIWNLKNPLYKMVYNYFKSVEKKFISSSSHIISLTQNGATEISSWNVYQQAKTPISVIPCCADLRLFSYTTERRNGLQKILGLSDNNFILSYLGSFGTWYMTNEMFDFFKVLYKKNQDSILLCITPDNPDVLESIAMRKDIPTDALRVVKVNREDVPHYASLSDWSMFFIKPVYSKKASSPTKMGELLSLGVPLVCNSGVGDVGSIMNDCSQGYIVTNFTNDEYEKITDSILQERNPNRDNLRSIAEKYYSLERGIEKYNSVYESVVTTN